MEYLGAWGTLIHEKNLKSKISCQTQFKSYQYWPKDSEDIVCLLEAPSVPGLLGGEGGLYRLRL